MNSLKQEIDNELRYYYFDDFYDFGISKIFPGLNNKKNVDMVEEYLKTICQLRVVFVNPAIGKKKQDPKIILFSGLI